MSLFYICKETVEELAMTYDQWKTTDPDDAELCEHGKPRPCPICQFERAMEREDLKRDERGRP